MIILLNLLNCVIHLIIMAATGPSAAKFAPMPISAVGVERVTIFLAARNLMIHGKS